MVGYLMLHLHSRCPIGPAANDADLRRIYLLAPVWETYRSWGSAAIRTSTFEQRVWPELARLVIMRRPLTPSLTGQAGKGAQ